jgi:CheY-like chemotaxis protein
VAVALKRILIIDDEAGIQAIARLGLKMEADWEVLTASSGAEGMAIAESQQPDAILLDVMMPGLDGLATFGQLQSNPATQCIPVILLTAKVQASEQSQFKRLGVAGVIPKPFNPLTLASEMAAILHWP